MNHATALQTTRWRGILWSLLLAIAGFAAAPDASAQQIDCSRLSAEVVSSEGSGDSCCFRFVLRNGLGSSIDAVRINHDSRHYAVLSGSPGDSTNVQNNYVEITSRNGLPQATDDVSICYFPRPNTVQNGTVTVIFTWYSSGRPVCSDTLVLKCGGRDEEGCVSLLNPEVGCNDPVPGAAQTFGWHFTAKNESNHYGATYKIIPVTQGVSVSPALMQANSPVAPGQSFSRGHHTITGAQPGQTVVFLIEMCGPSGPNSRDIVCCTTRVEVKMPYCEEESRCIDILRQSIECDEAGPNGARSYLWCFDFRNTTDFTINYVQVGNESVSVNPVQPGGTGRACIRLYGQPGPTEVGLLVCSVERHIDTVRNTIIDTLVKRRCCDMKVRLELPKCGPSDGCLEIVEQEIECDSNGYIWCFNVRNRANWNMGSVLLMASGNGSNLPGANFSPNPIVFRTPIQPGGISERICVRITGAQPGILPVVVYNNATPIDVTCADTVMLELPRCDHEERNCCDNFIINMLGTQPVAGSNGFTGILGLIQAGPAAITKVRATIVSASINGQPAYGYAVNGTILNPMGNGTVTPPGFGQEIVWQNAGGVPMMNPSFTLNWLRFPPMAPNARTDTLRFCIRWQFTDRECRTCDTLVCYSVVRRRILFSGGAVSGIDAKGNRTAGGEEGFIGGMLTGDNSGKLQILLPEFPEEFGTVKYTGLTVQADDGAMITGAVDANGSLVFTAQQGIVQGEFSLDAGANLTLNLEYAGLDGRPSLGHFVLVAYESSTMPGVVQQLPLNVTLRRDGTSGGDVIEAVSAEVPGSKVETFALHLRNSNGAEETLSGLRLTALSDLTFLAVGPTSNETEATLRFGVSSEDGHAYVSEAAEGTVTLPAGDARGPIYVTLAIGPESAPIVGFETLNSFGETVSEGEIDLRNISSIDHDGGVAGAMSQLGAAIPNPASGNATVGFTLTRSGTVSLTLRDARGAEMARLIEAESLEGGSHVVSFDVSKLPNGTYFYTLETESGTETGRMVIQR